jgi:hypothetical protein
MKITDEERKELKELYESYKYVKDPDSLKLLGGLIRTSKWYKNHKLTLKHVDSDIWMLDKSDCYGYYMMLSLKEILDTNCSDLTSGNTIVIIEFLRGLIERKSYTLYKPI